jgi:hypothetical protein
VGPSQVPLPRLSTRVRQTGGADDQVLGVGDQRWSRPQQATIGVVVALTLLGGFWLTHLPNVGGDTAQLMTGSDWIVRCVLHSPRVRCGTSADGTESMVGPFPFAQYAPDVVFKGLGFSPAERMTGLSVLSIAAFFAMLAIAWGTISQLGPPGGWPMFLIVLLTGPFLYYGNATWGEMVAASLVVCFTASALLRLRPPLIAATAFLAALTKETAFPFLVAIGLISLWFAWHRTRRSVRPHAFGMAIGIGSALGVSALFNVFRFGSPLNEFYLQPKFRVPDVSTFAEFFAGLFVAPNGGLLLFWASACVFLGLIGIAAARSSGTTRLVGIAVLTTFLLLSASLASWWMPFGWHAWGPRLTIAWIPGFLLLGVVTCGKSVGSLIYRLISSNSGLIAVVALLLLVALPQLGFLWNSGSVQALFFQPDEYCSAAITLESIETPEGSRDYYRCVRFRAWEKSPILLSAMRSFESFAPLTFAVFWAVAIGALTYLMRLQLMPGDATASRSRP